MKWKEGQGHGGKDRKKKAAPGQVRASVAVVPVVSQAICWSEQGMSYGMSEEAYIESISTGR